MAARKKKRKRKTMKVSPRARARALAARKRARGLLRLMDRKRIGMLASLVDWGNSATDCCDQVAAISAYLVQLDAWVQNTDSVIRANLPGGGDVPPPPKWPPA